MSEAASLGAFLSALAARPFRWSETDCFLVPADWVLSLRGVDPAAEFRGHYRTELGAARILKRNGGVEALFMRAALASGLSPTLAPGPGAVGLVQCYGRPVGAVRSGIGWAVKTPTGLFTRAFPTVAAWEV